MGNDTYIERTLRPVRYIALVVVCVCSFLFARAEVYSVQSVPSPKVQGQDYYVSNPDGVLSTEIEQKINALCTQLNRDTEVELAVVAIGAFDENRTAYGFSLDLFNHWGIGGADKNTGVLVFLASESRDIQIITGAGIEGILTDAECGEILDYNLDYLADNDFDAGIWHICSDIVDKLMEDSNRAELLLGWSPESTDGSYLMMLYLILAFLTLAMMAMFGYIRLQGKPGQTKSEIQEQSAGVKSTSGCLAVFFPIPMLFFYIYYIFARRRVQSIPPNCKQCGHAMTLLNRNDPRRVLSALQKKEEEQQAREYEGWVCPDCGEVQFIKRKGKKYYYFDKCPECGAFVLKTMSRTVVEKATSSHNGLQRNQYKCLFCGHSYTKDITLRRESSSYSSGGSSSWGGGSSRSSGSWGGGYSSGGGAGRSF